MSVGFKAWDENGRALVNTQGNFLKVAGYFDHVGTSERFFAYPSVINGKKRERLFIYTFLNVDDTWIEPTLTVNEQGVTIQYYGKRSNKVAIRVYYGDF